MKTVVVGFASNSRCIYQLRVLLAAGVAAGGEEVKTEAWVLGDSSGMEQELATLPCAAVLLAGSSLNAASAMEQNLAVLQAIYKQDTPEMILFTDDLAGGELSVRLAYREGLSYRTGVLKIEMQRDMLIVTCGVYGQNLFADFLVPAQKCILSVVKDTYEPLTNNAVPSIRYLEPELAPCSFTKDVTLEENHEQVKLEDAKRLVVAGRGVGGKPGVASVEAFARIIGAGFGVSRPVSADGWASHDRVIGISGSTAKPELTLLFGVSGAAAFLAGICGSRFTVGINRDLNAPVFNACDVGLVGEYEPVLRRLTERMLAEKKDGVTKQDRL